LIPDVEPAAAGAERRRSLRPAGWERNGIRLANAKIVFCGPEQQTALAIVDDNPSGHTQWNTYRDPGLPVRSGEELVFEWEEAYSIGMADFGSASYGTLPAGLYRFRLEGLTVMGVPNGMEFSVPLEVPVPFWQTHWFWIAGLLGLVSLATGGWRLTEWRKMKLRLATAERLRAVERERLRIAQDIHDDLGARVTQISLLSSAAERKHGLSAEASADFALVSHMSRNLVGALYETVWAVNPQNDHLDSLATYICQMGNQMCAETGLRCRLQIPDLPHEVAVSSSVRHNLVMTVKEAIHNVIKHAHATEVQIRMQLDGGFLTIEVSDNGKGFDPSVRARGNGLPNMKQRMEAVGGRWTQETQQGRGTRTRLELPLTRDPRPPRL
jgi:signal transduction histidine kinase